MIQKFLNFPAQKKLAVIALLLGFIALFAGSPYQSARTMMDVKDLSLMVENKVDHVTVDELADWIIKGKMDYTLIDLNEEKEFSTYHIPGAKNIQLPALTDGQIERTEKLVLYSSGGIHAAQAWMLLKAQRFTKVYTLLGGLEEWKDKVLFPQIPDSIEPSKTQHFNLLTERSKYFGGTPVGSSVAETKGGSMPALPKLSGGAGSPVAAGKKKKEGC